MTEEEELRVIRCVVDGAVEGFERLVLHYQDRLQRMIATILQDERRLAEDVAQAVFIEAFRRLKDFDPARSRFSTWLFMIGRSRAINALKKKRPTLLAEVPEGEVEQAGMEQREEFEILDRALQKLPEKQKRAFSLVVLEELTYAEAAQIELVSVGTMKSRVSRAREFLKASIEPE